MIDVFNVDPSKIEEVIKILDQELELVNTEKCSFEETKESRPFIHTMSPHDKSNTTPYIMCIQFKGHQVRLYADGTWGWECTAMSKAALTAMGIMEE